MAIFRMHALMAVGLAILVLGAGASTVFGWDWEAHGTLGPGDPTFHRPSTSFPPCSLSSSGTAVYYDVYTAYWPGGYGYFEATGTINRPVMASYPAGTFDPASACDNIFEVGGCEPLPFAVVGPIFGPAGNYDIVITHCYNGDTGSYDFYFAAAIFFDGFESGNLSAWDVTSP